MKAFLFWGILFMMASKGTLAILPEPIATQKPIKLKKHGDVRVDNYFWLKEKENPEVIHYLKQENAYADEALKDTLPLQETLLTEMKARIKEDDESVPYKKGDYYYFSRISKGQQYPVYYRKKELNSKKEELLLDVNELGKGFDYINVTAIQFHSNQNLMSYAVDTKGDRVFTIYFKDLTTGKTLDQKIEGTSQNHVWAENSDFLFYTQFEKQTLRWNQIFLYDFKNKTQKLVMEEKDEKFSIHVSKSLSKKFIFFSSGSTTSSEESFIPASNPLAKPTLFLKREKNHEYSIEAGEGEFYILTNWKAKNFRVLKCPFDQTQKKNWAEVIAHKENTYIDALSVFKNQIVLSERRNGLTQINIIPIGKKRGTYIQFPDPAYTVEMGANATFDTDTIRYDFESLNRPISNYDYNITTGKSVLLKEKEVPTYNSSNYFSERLFATAKDGTKIPVSLVYKKGFKKDGSAPASIYGYGSYGMSMDPYFSSSMVSLLDRGFVYAFAHIRGGSEMGRSWYENGKFLKKKNTFTDFIDVTEFLVKKKYANPKKLYARGGSAGGLLMGAVMNLRPELFNGVVAQVPFVDVVTTMLDSTLPLTTGEYEEWGNPNDQKYYKYMKSYSPYDNVKPKNYPNLLITTGLNDSQVPYWEPAKWTAKLREMRTDKSKLLLFKTELEVGHGGKSGRFSALNEVAQHIAFFLKLEGISK